MLKLLPITDCHECSHSDYKDKICDWEDHVGVCTHGLEPPLECFLGWVTDARAPRIPDEITKARYEDPRIPEWCPLDDAEEEE